MATLSAKDKIKLKVSKERVERWNRSILIPPTNPKDKDGNLKRCRFERGGHDYIPEETIGPDKLDDLHRATDGYAMRNTSDKLVRVGSDKGTYQIDGRTIDITDAKVIDGVLYFRMGVVGNVQRVRVLPEEVGFGPVGEYVGGRKPVDKGAEKPQGKRASESPFKRSGARIKAQGFIVETKGKG